MSDGEIYSEGLSDLKPEDEGAPILLTEPRRLKAGAGVAWIRQGWSIFRQRWGTWIIMYFIVMVISGLISLLPGIGSLINIGLLLFFIAGFMLACDAWVEGKKLEWDFVFAGFRYKFKELLILTLLYGVLGVVWGIFMVSMAGIAGPVLSGASSIGPALLLLLIMIVGLLSLIMIGWMMWFAPSLVVLNDVQPWQAVKMSVKAGMRNIGPFTVYGLIVGAFLVLLACVMYSAIGADYRVMVMLLVWSLTVLVFAPLIMITYYTSYCAIWIEPPLE